MTTISNNKLPEWRKTLNKSVENYQSMRAWYEENPDNPSAEQDMDAAEGDIEKLLKQCGVLIVLSLMDEIDELQERRKADSEPAGYHVIKECGKVGCSVATLEEAEKTRDFWNKKWTIRPYFYSAAPAPVVPAEMPKGLAGQIVSLLAHNIGDKFLAQKIWNACRAAMLQGAEPVSETYKLPELIEGMEVSIDVSTCDADAGNRYFGTVTEISELDTAKNGYILLVQDAKPNFDVNGNSPVQSPIDHGYRPECECSGCKATARICAELNNEEAEIFADGYNAAMLKVNKNASTELPNDANLSTNSPVIPDGYALVPVEPTDEMIEAAMNCEDVLFNSDESFCVQYREIYCAMVDTAPALNKGEY